MENKEMKRSFLSAQVDVSKFNASNFEKATDEEKRQQDVMGESTTFFKDGMRRLRKNLIETTLSGSNVFLVIDIDGGRSNQRIAMNGRCYKDALAELRWLREDGMFYIATGCLVEKEVISSSWTDVDFLLADKIVEVV